MRLSNIMKQIDLATIKRIELNILLEFDIFCKQNDLRYMLAGGTLLGAIRHKGFIPWDDDIDVCMPRDDYERLYEILKNKKMKDRFRLISYRDNSAIYPFFKLVDDFTVASENALRTGENLGLWIDIFPLDGCQKKKKKASRMLKKIAFYKWLINISNCRLGTGTTKWKAILKAPVVVLTRFINTRKVAEHISKISQSYDVNNSPCVASFLGCYGEKEQMPSSFLETVEVEFEGHMFPTSKEWEYYLSSLYGDYMELPPEDKRVQHSMVAYYKNEE